VDAHHKDRAMSLTDTTTCFAEFELAEALRPALPTAQRFLFVVELPMRHAGMRRLQLQVESVGPVGAPAVWVAGGISANRHVLANALDGFDGWWQDAVGAGRGLDPYRQRLLSFDWVGADGSLDAPIDTADQADAIALALDALGIDTLHGFVGASYGGMVALQFAARHPARVERLVVLSAAHRPHPYASAFRALQRQIVALGQLQDADELGLSLARQLAMLSYRTPQEFAQRFAAAPQLEGGRARCAAEDYLQVCGQRYVARWNTTAFLRLSESIDLHAVDPSHITVPTTLFAVEQDWLAPPSEIAALAGALAAPSQLTTVPSLYGHDAFLKETAAVDAVLRSTLCC
jgi:homoserine O-acetyltransferase/O-succinyltransferase